MGPLKEGTIFFIFFAAVSSLYQLLLLLFVWKYNMILQPEPFRRGAAPPRNHNQGP